MKKVDLNVDIGEGFPYDRELLQFATSANVCLGAHAGSVELTFDTVRLCRDLKKRAGAHPGYPDRATMGRGPRPAAEEVEQSFLDQRDLMGRLGLRYVKPHGSFYNESAQALPEEWDDHEEQISQGSNGDTRCQFLTAANPAAGDVLGFVGPTCPLMGLAGTTHPLIAELAGARFIREGFADRAYQANGMLVPRSEPGAVLHDPDEIGRQVLVLAERVDSICLHGDTPNCLEFAELVYRTLTDHGYEVGY